MGMYTSICGKEIKFSGLIAKVVYKTKGIDQVDNMVELDRTEVSLVLFEIDNMLTSGKLSIVDNGSITKHICLDIAAVVQFASILVDWLVNTDEDVIVFA